MLTRMKLGNFKSWQNLDIELAPITVLFGTNSSGKSSVLQALLMLKQTVNSLDPGEHINFGSNERNSYVNLGNYNDVIFNNSKDNSLEINLNWQAMTSSMDSIYAFATHEFLSKQTTNWHKEASDIYYKIVFDVDSDDVIINELIYALSPVEGDESIFLVSKKLETSQYMYTMMNSIDSKNKGLNTRKDSELSPESCYKIPLNIDINSGTMDKRLHLSPGSFSAQFELLIKNIHYLGPLRLRPERTYYLTGSNPQIIEPNGANTIDALVSSERKQRDLLKQVAKWMNDVGLADDLIIEPISTDKRIYETKIKIGSKLSSLLDVGFGISQILPVITMLFFVPEGSIILLEQPELHLHPSAQTKLADLFLHVAETRKLQLIIESHSEHLLTRLQRRVAETEYTFATPENIKTYFCSMGENGSEIQSVEIDEYGQIQNYPQNFFGDISGDLDALTDAALARRREELSHGD